MTPQEKLRQQEAIKKLAETIGASVQFSQQKAAPAQPLKNYETVKREVEALEQQRRAAEEVQAVEAAESVVKRVQIEHGLTYSHARVWVMLRSLANYAAGRAGYHKKTSQVAVHLPAELLAFELGIARSTLYLALDALEARDLVRHRGHYTGDTTRQDGCVFLVRLRGQGRLKWRIEWLKHQYRDLEDDVRKGRTVWALKQSDSHKQSKDHAEIFDRLTSWTLTPGTVSSPSLLTVRLYGESAASAFHTAFNAERGARRGAVDSAARMMAATLRDGRLMFHRWLLWQLHRLKDRGEDYTQLVWDIFSRISHDSSDEAMERPGAVFLSELRKLPIWPRIENMSRTVRVA